MILGYDFDGVLAEGPPPNVKKWGLMNGAERNARKVSVLEHYRNAKQLFKPSGQFHVITARKGEPEIIQVSKQWLIDKLPGQVLGVHFLKGSRTVENAGIFKYSVIKEQNITHFYEDNIKVLKVIRKYKKKDSHPVELFFVEWDANWTMKVTPLEEVPRRR